jgi:hypothetical protein
MLVRLYDLTGEHSAADNSVAGDRLGTQGRGQKATKPS